MHTPSAFLIIRASAGSGKTFRLVQEYLMCCLGATEPDYFRRILAITFTRNAAMEMRERILSGIDEVAQGEGDFTRRLRRPWTSSRRSSSSGRRPSGAPCCTGTRIFP